MWRGVRTTCLGFGLPQGVWDGWLHVDLGSSGSACRLLEVSAHYGARSANGGHLLHVVVRYGQTRPPVNSGSTWSVQLFDL